MLKRLKNEDNSDQLLVKEYRESGDQAFLGELYGKYLHLIYGLCLKYLKSRESAQDASMEIFEKVSSEIRKSEITHFKSWLYVVARNHCLSILRKKQNTCELEFFSENNYADYVEYESFFTLIDKEAIQNKEGKLHKCIEKLNEQQKLSITLFYFKEACYQEIAQMLNTTVNKIKSYLQNGKRNLKRCMELNEEAA